MTTYYVSAQAANGIPAGDDVTGDGSAAHPFATVDQANAMAQTGDTVYLNDGDYTPARDLRITTGVSWLGVTDYGATLHAAAGQSRVVSVAEGDGGTVTIGKINIDGGNAATSDIVLSDTAIAFTLNLEGTHLLNAARFGVQGSSTGTHANLVMNDVVFDAPAADTMVYLPSLAAGTVSIHGGSVNLPNQDMAGYGGIATITASTVGPHVTISGVTATIAATGGDGIHYGIRIRNVPEVLIENNKITQTGTASDTIVGQTVVVSYDQANPLDSSNGVIRDNMLTNLIPGGAGKLIVVGADSDPGAALHNYANNFEIYGNTGSGTAANQATGLHGILVGWQDGAKVYDNVMQSTALAYVLKGMTGQTLVSGNTDIDTTNKSFYQKGGEGVEFIDNSSLQSAGFAPDMVVIGDYGVGDFPAQGAVIVGNHLVYSGQSDSFVTVSPGSSAALISGNSYSAPGLSSTAWILGGTVYGSFAAWQAAAEANASFGGTPSGTSEAPLVLHSVSGPAVSAASAVDGVQTYTITFTAGQAATASFAIANPAGSGETVSGLLEIHAGGGHVTSAALSGTGTEDGTFSALAAGHDAVFTASYDGHGALDGQVVRVFTDLGQIFDIVYRTADAVNLLPPPARDFDADGHSDILWRGTGGEVAVWSMNGLQVTAGSILAGSPGAYWTIAGTGDFNGDGHADILWRGAGGEVSVWQMNGTQVTGGAVVGVHSATDWTIVGTGDFDGDGRADILLHGASGAVSIWQMNGTQASSMAVLPVNPGAAWSIAGTGDFDGDGKADILWRGADGSVSIWEMNGTQIAHGEVLGPNPGKAWSIAGTADYDGDGKSDILWRAADGHVAIWEMNGTQIAHGAVLGGNPGDHWTIAG